MEDHNAFRQNFRAVFAAQPNGPKMEVPPTSCENNNAVHANGGKGLEEKVKIAEKK